MLENPKIAKKVCKKHFTNFSTEKLSEPECLKPCIITITQNWTPQIRRPRPTRRAEYDYLGFIPARAQIRPHETGLYSHNLIKKHNT